MRTWTSGGPWLAAGLVAGLAATAGVGSAQHRQADAHEHGRGTLNIAIDGTRLVMELEVPGADIVGFEHNARTEQQKAAIDKAVQQLMVGDALFQFSAEAGCTLETSGAALEGEDHGHGGKEAGRAAEKGHGHDGKVDEHDKADHAESEHSGFRAEYAFHCKSLERLTGIGFGYFKVFPGAQRLDVTIIAPKGQTRFEVTRAKPRADLGGMM